MDEQREHLRNFWISQISTDQTQMSGYLGDSEVPLVTDMAVVFIVQLVSDIDTVRALPEHCDKPGIRSALLQQATIISRVSTTVTNNHTVSQTKGPSIANFITPMDYN